MDTRAVLEALPPSSDAGAIEKSIGFEGRPDPGTGYYCRFDQGRLVAGGGAPPPDRKQSSKNTSKPVR